jgi:hypothetical protein
MQAAPTIATSGFSWVGGSPIGNAVSFYDNAGGAWVTLTGGLSVTTAVPPSATAVILRFQAGTSFSGAAGALGHLYAGSPGFIVLLAEL